MYHDFLGPRGLQGTHMDTLKSKNSKWMHSLWEGVSLHFGRSWPIVRRGTPGVGVILYYGFNNRCCAGKPGRFILWILTKKQMEVLYCHELFIFRKIVRFMPVSWVCEYSIVKGFVCTLLVYLRKSRSLLSFFFVSFCSTHFFFWNQTVWKHWCIISVSLKMTCNLGCEMCTISEYMYAIIHVHIREKYIQCGPSMT